MKKEVPSVGNQENQSPKMNFFYSFFCWCSGARLYILKECPSDYNKYMGIGAVVFMTGVMATVTGSYALYTVFQNIVPAVIFGMFWGVLIFFLDWYIISSLKKENKFIREFISAFPRILLAVLIAFVISKPLELKLFEKEIEKELAVMNELGKQNFVNQVNKNYKELDKLKSENEKYRMQIQDKEARRDELFRMIIAEAEGRSPTNQVGKGPVYKEKKAEFDRIEKELRSLKDRNNRLIENNDERILLLRNERDSQMEVEKETYSSKGFLGRLRALSNLTAENNSVKHANIFIIILFLIIESSPMVVKLMSRRGPYDILLETTENQRNYISMGMNEEANLEYQKQKLATTDLKTEYYTNKLKVEKESLNRAFEAKKEYEEKILEKWKETQNEKLTKEPHVVIKTLDELLNNNNKNITD